MKIKLDENIPHTVRGRLAGRQLDIDTVLLDIDTVLDEGLGGRNDQEIWAAAQSEGRLLVTQDLAFSDTRKFDAGHPPRGITEQDCWGEDWA